MKKLLSFVIVALMIVSSVIPVFAVSSEPAAPGEENHMSIWLEDTEFNPDDTTEVIVYANVSHNTDGFNMFKFFIFYPECLTLNYMDGTGILTSTDVTAGIENTENTMNLQNAFDTLGLDPADYLDGHTKYTSPFVVADRSDHGKVVDCFGNGRAIEFSFTYDPALNPSGADIELRMFDSPDDDNHCDNPASPYCDQPVKVSVYGGTIKVLGGTTPPPPVYTEPTIEISNATINAGDPTATFDVSVYNNPGIWSLQTFVIYDKDISFNSFANGTVVPAAAMPLTPNEEASMRDKDAETTLDQALFAHLKTAFPAQGAAYVNKLMSIGQFENSAFTNITGDGKLYSMTLNTASLAPGTYDIFLAYNPESAVNADYDDLTFDVVQGTLTVVGETVCPHSETENINIVPADCTNPGSHDVKCKICGEIIETGVVDPALGHDYVDVVTPPTCTEDGYTTHTCSRCGDEYVDTPVEKLGHDPLPAVEENKVEPGCTTPGSYDEVVYCNRCGNELSRETKTLGALDHDWRETEVTGNCGEIGTIHYICDRCGETKTETGTLIEHNWEETESKEPTCTEPGYIKYKCSRCGSTDKQDNFEPLGHDPLPAVEENRVEPGCTTPGSYDEVIYCNRCGDELSKETKTIDALGHDPLPAVEENRVEPGCTTPGSYDEVIYCNRCGNELSRETKTIDALGHDYVDVVTPPTCTEDGYTTHTCSRCGDEIIDTPVEKLGHDYVDVVTPPTCTEDGYTTHTCSRCGDEYIDTPVEKLGHDYKDVVTEPTCTEAGYTTHTCSRCGDVYTTPGAPALGHDMPSTGVEENRVEPTCTTPGSVDEVKYCTRCGVELSRDTYPIPALGHDWDEGVDTAATCTTDGGKLFTCKRCGATELRDKVPALGHDWDEGVETAPTCTEDGGKLFTCKRCGVTELRDVIPALGHDWDGGKVTKLPTADAEGEKTYTCKRDPSHVKTEPIPKLEPKETDDNKTTPTTPDKPANNGGAKQTGDSITTLIFISMFALISGAAVIVAKKKLFDK